MDAATLRGGVPRKLSAAEERMADCAAMHLPEAEVAAELDVPIEKPSLQEPQRIQQGATP
jgi:hypothetical protein